jgi:hypothetical protein
MIAALLTWLAIQATAWDCAAAAGGGEALRVAGSSETVARAARDANVGKAPAS